jgi:hypothetical protein
LIALHFLSALLTVVVCVEGTLADGFFRALADIACSHARVDAAIAGQFSSALFTGVISVQRTFADGLGRVFATLTGSYAIGADTRRDVAAI